MSIANTIIEVKNGNINQALKEYKSKTIAYGIREILTEKKYFTKPSDLKRWEREEAVRKNKRKNKNK